MYKQKTDELEEILEKTHPSQIVLHRKLYGRNAY